MIWRLKYSQLKHQNPRRWRVSHIWWAERVEPRNLHLIYMSTMLLPKEEKLYFHLIFEYRNMFEWSYKEFLGLDPKVAVHNLAIRKRILLKKTTSTTCPFPINTRDWLRGEQTHWCRVHTWGQIPNVDCKYHTNQEEEWPASHLCRFPTASHWAYDRCYNWSWSFILYGLYCKI